MFRRLRTRLTVLYAALFCAALLLVSLAAYTAIAANAQRIVRDELSASGAVFDRIWAMRSNHLREGAELAAHDFGFRQAVATGDLATTRSALENLRARFGVDEAFILTAAGGVVTAQEGTLSADLAEIRRSIEQDNMDSGAVVLRGAPYQAVAAPVMAPTLVGWVVFAVRLNQPEMRALEQLSAIPLEATVVVRAPSGQWRNADATDGIDASAASAFINDALDLGSPPQRLRSAAGDSIAMVKALRPLGRDAQAVLLLRYPLALALAPYRPLAGVLILIGALCLATLVLGSWLLARSVTRPLSALGEAARRLQSGEHAKVAVSSRDELGDLAETFNAMAADIRDRERRILRQALIDAETHLPNRLALERRLRRRRSRDATGFIVLAALGVDRFADVRDAIGYNAAGDLIGKIGARLRGVRPDAAVARLSTDALGLAFDAPDEESARRTAIEVLAALEHPVAISGHRVDVNLTIGLASDLVYMARALSLIDRANIALDQARAARRKIAFFDPASYGDPTGNLSLMSEMCHALESGEMELHYQPKLNLRDGAVTGVEALLRWRHHARGMLAPELFVAMAEKTGHIRALTEWVLARAVRDHATIVATGRSVPMSVNVSARVLGDEDFAAAALAMIRQAPGGICFDIAETALAENVDLTLRALDRFVENGVAISIDHYGAGLSSLSYLRRIRAHALKIDRSFIADMSESSRGALLVRSAIELAHGLGFEVTADGVEDGTVLALLAAMGCDHAQGHIFARPMPINDLLSFLRNDRPAQHLVAGRGAAA